MTKPGDKLSIPLVAALLLLMAVSFAVLRSGRATLRGNEMNFDRAVFTVVNAATLTGFQQPINPDEYKPLGRTVVFLLMTGGTLVVLIVGGWAVVRVTSMPYTDWQIAQSAIFVYLLAVLLGATGLIGPKVHLASALFQAASAFGNVGLSLGAMPGAMDRTTHLILLPLAFIGGLGIPVVHDLAAAVASRTRLHSHTIWALTMSAAVFLVGLGLILLIETLGGTPIRQAVALGSAESLNSRSAGLPIGAFAALSRASQWIVLILMAIGACTAGTGGGIKATTLLVLVRDTGRLLSGRIVGRIFAAACAWFGIYLLILLATTILLVATQPQLSGDRVLFLAVSAASNVGTSHEPVSITGVGLYTLSGAMLLGRMLSLGVLWWTAKNVADTDVAVG